MKNGHGDTGKKMEEEKTKDGGCVE